MSGIDLVLQRKPLNQLCTEIADSIDNVLYHREQYRQAVERLNRTTDREINEAIARKRD